MSAQHYHRRRSLEGYLARKHLIHDATKGVDVGANVCAVPLRLLRGHVVGSAHYHSGCGHRREGFGSCYAKVGDLGVTVLGDEHVLRLNVPVGDATRVCGRKPLCDLAAELQDAIDRQAFVVRYQIGEGSGQVLHHDEVASVVFAHVVDLDDVRVVYLGRHGRLSVEALQVASVGRQLGLQDLYGDDAVYERVNSLVDGALAANGYVLKDLVSAYSLLVQSLLNLLERRPRGPPIKTRIVGEPAQVGAVGVHHVDFPIPVPAGGESDHAAVGRPRRLHIISRIVSEIDLA